MTATLLSQTGKITRQELQTIPVPHGTSTHQPLSHFEIVEAILETLGFRRIEVVRDEYAVSHDGMRMFGVLDLELGITGVRFSNRHQERQRQEYAPRHVHRLPGSRL